VALKDRPKQPYNLALDIDTNTANVAISGRCRRYASTCGLG